MVGLLVAMALFAMFFFVSLYMQQVLGYDALKAGLAYLPLAFGIIVSAGVASQLVTRIGFKPTLIAGLLLTAGGLIWFSQVSPDGKYVSDILPASLLAAVGLGFAFVPMMIAAVSGVSAHDAGLASGLINTSQQIGGALGLAILATVANSRTEDVMATAGGDPQALPTALTEGFQNAFLVGAGFAIVGALLAMVLISNKDSREHAEAARRGDVEARCPVPGLGHLAHGRSRARSRGRPVAVPPGVHDLGGSSMSRLSRLALLALCALLVAAAPAAAKSEAAHAQALPRRHHAHARQGRDGRARLARDRRRAARARDGGRRRPRVPDHHRPREGEDASPARSATAAACR